MDLVAVESPGGGLAAVAHLGIGGRHDAVLRHALAETGLAGVGVDLDVLGHEGGQELRRLPGVLPVLDGLEQLVGGSDHAGELQGAGAGVLPVDPGLGAREVAAQRSQQLLRQGRLAGGLHHLLDAGPHQLVGVGDGSGSQHRGGVDERQDLAGEQPGLDRPAYRLSEQGLVRVVQHHPGAEQREGGGPDAGEVGGYPQGVLPVEVHPGATGGLPVRGVILHRQQQAPHHERGRGRRPAPVEGIEPHEVVVGDQLVAAGGELVVERAPGHQVAEEMARLEEAALGINASEHHVLRGKLRWCHSPGSVSRSRAFGANGRPIFCSLT